MHNRESKFFPPMRLRNLRYQTVSSEQQLDNLVLKTILEWAIDDYTDPEAIDYFLRQIIQPIQMQERIRRSHSWNTHLKMIQTIDLQIRSMLNFRAVVTFFDILKTIDSLYPNHRSYVGPLMKIPLVKEVIFLNFIPRVTPPELRLANVIELCGEFFNQQIENSKRPNDEVMIKAQSEMPFLYFLKEKFNLSHTKELGLKITNFNALSDAVQIHKINSYSTDFHSKKLTRLLRTELTEAMNKIVEKLKSSKIFPKETVRKSIENFATLPFADALKKFFQPFLDEEDRIFDEHELKIDMLKDDPLSTIKILFKMLSDKKIFGKIFHLSAVIGAIHECKNDNEIQIFPDNQISLISKDDEQTRWKNEIFHPLLCDIGLFLQLYLSKVDYLSNENINLISDSIVTANSPTNNRNVNPFLKNKVKLSKESIKSNNSKCVEVNEVHPFINKLNEVMERIIKRSEVIIDVIGSNKHVILNKHKNACIIKLSNCCQDIIKESLLNRLSLAKLHLDILPQAYWLLIKIMSCDKLEQLPIHSTEISESVLDIVYKSIMKEYIAKMNNEPLTLEMLMEIEKDILKVMNISHWPLKGTYLEYVSKTVIFESETPSADEYNGGPCHCIAITPDYLNNKIERLPKEIDLDSFTTYVLSSQYGIITSASTKKHVETSWKSYSSQMYNVMEDGIAVVVDIESSNMANNIRPHMIVTDSEKLMQIISEVPLLEEVSNATKWNELYRHHWGDICQYVQENVLLASKYNVRIAETQLGRLKLNIIINEIELKESIDGLVTDNYILLSKYTRSIVGNFVSLAVKKLPLPFDLDNLISESLSKSLNIHKTFSLFLNIALSIIPSEFMIDFFKLILDPISHHLFDTLSFSELQKALTNCSSSTLTFLRQLIKDHPSLIKVQSTISEIVVSKRAEEEIKSVTTLVPQSLEEMDINESVNDINEITDHSTYNNNREIVEDIRRSEFGVGIKFGLETDAVLENCNRRMARLVDHFSSDLYANPTHFVLELIQNADDNIYRNNERASLHLKWKNDDIDNQIVLQVVNNECGFTESDLRSLCDIGASTKSTQRLEKIGRKGIGFKSVFLVSDCPEVHSNGFHVRFNRFLTDKHNNKVPNNALVPEWINETNLRDTNYQDGQTTIVLPIVKQLQSCLQASVSKQLHPSLLLFLRKLKRISIDDYKSIELVDEDCFDNRKVVITSDGIKYCWFMCSRQVVILDSQLQKISPGGISRTDISIAVPFNDQESRDMPAFAFLPIRSYGLRFIINADFTIPASREDINKNCPWNKWLIEQASEVFIYCINQYVSNNNNINYTDITRFIDSVPLRGEVPGDSPFTILIPKLRNSLSQLFWLPDRNGSLYKPTQLIIQSDDHSLLTKILCERLDMSFLHTSITENADDRRLSVLKWLGCCQLSLTHLASLLSTISREELADQSLIKSIIIAIHNALQNEGSTNVANRVLALLRSLPLWPILSTKNEIISIEGSPVSVFLPPTQWLKVSPPNDPYYLLRRIISPSFIASFILPNNTHVNAAISVLRRLSILELNNTTMVEYAIAPRLSNIKQSRQWLIKVSQFLVEHCSYQNYKDLIFPNLSFATITYTDKGSSATITHYSEMSRVHLPLSLEPNNNVVSLLQGRVSYVVVDEAYIQSHIPHNQWITYFFNAGVPKTFYSALINENISSYPEIISLINLKKSVINIELLRYLDLNVNILNASENCNILQTLSTLAWIPVSTSHSDVNTPDNKMRLSKTFYLPSQVVYLCSNNPNKLLISNSLLVHFPFCPVMFQNETLPRQLGMTIQVTAEHILNFIKSAIVEKSVSLCKEQVQDLYTYINRNFSKLALRDMFSRLKTLLNNDMLLLVPTEDDKVDIVASTQCYWSLPLNQVYIQSQQVYDDLNQLLIEPHYHKHQRPLVILFPELKELFVDIMKVQEFPLVESIAECLHSVLGLLTPDRLKELNTAEIDLIADVYNIIHSLDNYHNQTCRSQIREMRLIPCISGRYRSFNEHNNNNFRIYTWRNMSNVEAFQNVIDKSMSPISDFLAINCFSKRETFQQVSGNRSQNRLSASQFLIHYFNLPVLEDNICRYVKNKDQFQKSAATKSMFASLEIIVTGWINTNMTQNAASQAKQLLGSISNFLHGDNVVEVTSSLLGQRDIKFDEEHKVYIGFNEKSDSFDLMIGEMDLEKDCIEIFDSVMNALNIWLLDGDVMSHYRHRFKKFYKSLLDLIETSDRNQVSIFIRSHNLRINPFAIDYIYKMFDLNIPSPIDSEHNSPRVASPLNQSVNSPSMTSLEESRKRKQVSIEYGTPAKHPRVEPQSDNIDENDKQLSRPQTPNENCLEISINEVTSDVIAKCSRSVSPLNKQSKQLRFDQVSLSSMDPMYLSGRIGEQLAYDKLNMSRRLGEWNILKMDWVNEHEETRLPYDFKLCARRLDSGPIETIYLEVKATTNMTKKQFDLSAQEVTSAWSFKSQYHLLLVFHSGTYCDKKVQYAHIPDVLGQLQDNNCKLLIDLESMLKK